MDNRLAVNVVVQVLQGRVRTETYELCNGENDEDELNGRKSVCLYNCQETRIKEWVDDSSKINNFQ